MSKDNLKKKPINSLVGGLAKDARGQIRYVNEFDMSLVKRFYILKNADLSIIRGWRGHKKQQRWFYTLSGSFNIYLVEVDNWITSSRDLSVLKVVSNASDMSLLNVPAGYATAFQALEPDSEILVFADSTIEVGENDDYTWPLNYFNNHKYF
ncbi:sugar epimerase [Sphingobacterium sp. DK4209]|uniref:Sugar epimerase n=1 Tax=Sphingobacterium zhuxiongii TaxID=2662364 RepID=A0A5Q0QF74_9SPHI|nr:MULTISPECIES: WxcM-like domain-containing protein [unclassified Sphingobacterium]MVZ65756.1 sugar epimerase [Sphingobacterium sp. DK4209]QGA27954.1 sugar epimerase [Sphingobacterium sp. dk4302]